MHTMHTTPPANDTTVPGRSHHHAVIWLDHHEAKIVHFSPDDSEVETVHPADPPHQLHIKSGSASGTHITTEPAFFQGVASACGEAKAILLIGPSTAKTEFVTYLRQHLPLLAGRIIEVKPADKMTDPQLLAAGRLFFKGADRLTSQ